MNVFAMVVVSRDERLALFLQHLQMNKHCENQRDYQQVVRLLRSLLDRAAALLASHTGCRHAGCLLELGNSGKT